MGDVDVDGVSAKERVKGLLRSRRFRVGLAATGVVGAVLVWVVGFTSVVGVRNVDVRGTSVVSADAVRVAAGVPSGRPLARVDLGAVTARVETIPGVAHARVSRSWPSMLTIDIAERR